MNKIETIIIDDIKIGFIPMPEDYKKYPLTLNEMIPGPSILMSYADQLQNIKNLKLKFPDYMKTKEIHTWQPPKDIDKFWDTVNISQSLIRALKEPHCPFAVFHMSLARTIATSNENMLRGLYFESQVIGETALGEKIDELPLLQSGKKSADHLRIDEQIERFETVMKDYNIKFISKQLRLEYQDPRFKYKLSGVIDAVGTIADPDVINQYLESSKNDIFNKLDGPGLEEIAKTAMKMYEEGNPAIFDVKLTKSISKSTGDWSWKYPQNMPSTQPAMLTYLVKMTLQKQFPFYYLVFDYSTELDYIVVKKQISNMDIAELEQDISDTEAKLDGYRTDGWNYNPDYERCKSCPLLEGCPKAITIKPIINV